MLPARDMLFPSEQLLGEYQVEIARWSHGRWTPTVPILYATLTIYRLILQPQTRKQREPAIIPAGYIRKVTPFSQEMYSGLMLTLTTGHRIALFVPSGYREAFMDNLRAMTSPSDETKRKPAAKLSLGDLHRIIQHLSRL